MPGLRLGILLRRSRQRCTGELHHHDVKTSSLSVNASRRKLCSGNTLSANHLVTQTPLGRIGQSDDILPAAI